MSDRYRKIPTQTLLRQVAAARAAGDWRTARDQWEACIARARQRVVVVVDTYVASGHIPSAERDDVVQLAMIRAATKLVEKLDSLEERVFYAAMATLAKYQCQDSRRRYLKRDQREKSLDAPGGWGDEDDAPGRYDKAVGAEARERWDRDGQIVDAARRLDDVIPRLRDPRAQKILTLQRLGVKDRAIAEEIGITVENVQTIRSRALRELRGMIEP